MEYITTTQLRTHSSQLVSNLQKGKKVSLIYRSKVVGEITPAPSIKERRIFDAKKFEEAMKSLRPKKLVPKKHREKVYRKHLMAKYKNLTSSQ